MKRSRVTRFTAAVVAAAIGLLGIQDVHAQPLLRVEQGSAVVVHGGGHCTVGLNDPANRRSFVAAHCGPEGARVRIVDHNARIASAGVGTIYRSKAYDGRLGNDWAAIQWDDGVQIAGNVHSGDARVSPAQVAVGERVCYFGQTTQRDTGRIVCGAFGGNVGNTFFVQAPASRPGDSGGPVWVPGRGFIGVLSSQWKGANVPVLGGRDFVVGVYTEDGPAVPEAQLLGTYAQNIVLPPTGSSAHPLLGGLRQILAQVFAAFAGLVPGLVRYR